MNSQSSTIVQRLWNYCNVLRDDGVSYGDYVEQLTYLLFLKMADEQTKPPYKKPSIIQEAYAWPSFQKLDGSALENYYRETLIELGKSGGMLGIIFRKAQNRIQDPAKLKRLIALIDEEPGWGWISTSRARSTKAYCKRTPKIPRAALASASRRVRSSRRWWRSCDQNKERQSATRPAVRHEALTNNT